ncbi:helix-turn-helix domain-containing protein [Streptomyces flavidovirens]|uniref:helix-turn-helix domain-containing protein n=1 Tax=Streptomyces flavidovirens TaxID=67298 RepID=UPI001FCB5367|nr:helix-turn-helix domain-containing protein [Streptomyces flavidovirens]
MGMSVRAVAYRLSRIRQLTGHDLTDPDQRYILQTAALGARLLNWPSHPPPARRLTLKGPTVGMVHGSPEEPAVLRCPVPPRRPVDLLRVRRPRDASARGDERPWADAHAAASFSVAPPGRLGGGSREPERLGPWGDAAEHRARSGLLP